LEGIRVFLDLLEAAVEVVVTMVVLVVALVVMEDYMAAVEQEQV
jgi:hypothetical protein